MPGQEATFGGGFSGGIGSTDQYAPKWLPSHIEKLIGTFRDAVGDDIDINWTEFPLQDRGRPAHRQGA